MRAFVFTDKSLAGDAGRFVWLDLDGEKARNAAFKRKFPIRGYPTFMIVDPRDESTVAYLLGGMSLGQLHQFLDEGEAAAALRGAAPAGGANVALARADRFYGAGQNDSAIVAYAEALKEAPPGWPSYGRAANSYLLALQLADQGIAAADFALASYPRVRGTLDAVGIAAVGLDCALMLPPENPRRAGLRDTLETWANEVATDASLEMAADDRSGLYISLLEARKDVNDSTGARRVAETWSAFLDAEAAKARTPQERSVFDSHRLSAYLELGQPERAIPMLEASQRDMPDDYNPPARLAIAYRALKRWDEGLAASARALKLAYGPRKIGFYTTRADLFLGKGDKESARRTLEEAIAFAGSLPEGQRSDRTIAALKKRLDGMNAPATSAR